MTEGRRIRSGKKRWARSIALAFGLMLAALIALLLIRTLAFKSRQLIVAPVKHVALDRKAVAGRLGGAIRFKTISRQYRPAIAPAPFKAFHEYLMKSFPLVHQRLKRERVGKLSLLYTWAGHNPTLKPILWVAHMDVVPVEAKDRAFWKQPPFSGTIADGYIWGRGTLDDKGQALAMLEAMEFLLAKGFRPPRTLILAIGHDEEVGGRDGAGQMAKLLGNRGVKPLFILDEGLVITHGLVPGVKPPVALIGIAEKGYITLALTVMGRGGHASMPPRRTAIGILARAIQKLEDNPMPARFTGAVRKTFEAVGPEMSSFFKRMAFANLWLLGGVVQSRLTARSATNALIRTTLAPTMLTGAVKENVLPQQARLLINVRTHPADSVKTVLAHVREVVGDKRVKVTIHTRPSPASKASSTESAGYRHIVRAIRQIFPGVLVGPGLMIAMTDSRHYRNICKDIYRFAPMHINKADQARFHGLNERLSVKNYLEMINFYIQLLKNANQQT